MTKLLNRLFVGVLLAGILVSIMGGAFSGHAQSTNDSSRIATLSQPGDAGFDAALDAKFPGLRDVAGFGSIEPLLAILQNDPGHGVKAYVIQWTFKYADGSTSKASLPVMDEPTAQASFGGQSLVGQKIVLQSAETELVSPFFHLPASQSSRLLSTHAMRTIIADALRKSSSAQTQQPLSVGVSLDAIIYDDGLFAGPDESALYERYIAEEVIQRNEGKVILSLLQSGTSDADIASVLSQQVQTGNLSTASDALSLYDAARGRMARRLLAVLDGNGSRTDLHNVVTRLSRARLTKLRR